MGRGDERLCIPYDNAPVTIGISLGTSPSVLSLTSKEPFYIVVTARLLSTPYPDKAVTVDTDPSALDCIDNRSIENLVCTTNPKKKINIRRNSRWCRLGDLQDLRKHHTYITIPPIGQGCLTVQHQVPFDRIEAANLIAGERYQVKLSRLCLGVLWFTYGSLEEDLKDVRFWARPDPDAELEDEIEGLVNEWDIMEMEAEGEDCYAEYLAELISHRAHSQRLQAERNAELNAKYPGGDTCGEDPDLLAIIPEDESPIEFEVVP